MNEIQEIRFQVGESWKGTYDGGTLYGNANVVQDAEGLSVYRSLKSGNVGHPLNDSNWWFRIIDMSSIKEKGDQLQELDVHLQQNETLRIEAEQARELAETARENQANEDHTRAGEDHTRAEQDHTRAGEDHTQADGDHTRAGEDHTRAGEDHTQAGEDHTRAGEDHTRAGEDHTQADGDHTRAGEDHTRAEQDHTRAEQDHDSIASKADIDGTYPAMSVGNIESWKNSAAKVEDIQNVMVFTAGGDASINSDIAAQLLSIVAGSRTAGLTGLMATGFNLLRNATQIGSGQVWYFAVPYLKFGTYGTADENNGILFTGSNQEKLTPTVYWKALSAGVPTSATDGVAAGYTDSNGYRFYTTPSGHEGELGYFIVQVTRSTTCAHVAWSSRYNEYKAVDNAADAGSTVALTSLINNIHGNGLMYKVGNIADGMAFVNNRAVWVRRNDRVQGVDLTWTNTLQEDGETYIHTATITAMKEGGVVECTNTDININVSGKDVSYSDNSATAITTDYIYFQLATDVNGTVSGTYTFSVEDWGLVVLTGMSGTVISGIVYGQNLVDTLRLLATSRFDNSMRVIAEALNQLADENERKDAYIHNLEEKMIPLNGIAAPSVVPSFLGQQYIDTTNKKVYIAMSVTGQTSDWIGLN